MRILYLSQYFPPEVGATQTRAVEMARGLVRAGHHVTMIAEFPNHPTGIIPPEYRGRWFERAQLDGIEVIRVWVSASPVKNFRTRLAFYLSYMLMAALAGLFLARGKFDAIYATSPPLFVGGAALVISYLRRIPLVFEVRDLWPESAVALGELRNQRAIRIAEWLERTCYRRAKRVVVVTRGIFDNLTSGGKLNPQKLVFIPNGANTDLFTYEPRVGFSLKESLGLGGKFVVLYAGIHGIAQGLETVIATAQKLTDDPDVHFLFVGEGPVKADIIALAEANQLTNVTFHPAVPRNEMPGFLSAADVALVPLKRLDLFQGALPSKMFDAWACNCPTLITVDGEARAVLEQSEAGLFAEPENPDALTQAIRHLKGHRPELRQMGERGRQAVEQHYSRQAQAAQLVDLLAAITGAHSPRQTNML
ncbi:MAG: glycosyltransferase WbuB [Chloroflexi bacterium]|nr:MAG: glycosyltransferase WbuB [Chloroflexota bacterium]